MADRQHDAGSKLRGAEVTESSRVQKMLTEQNEWIDQLKSQIMRLELDIIGYRVRNKQLEAALREIAALGYWDGDRAMRIASKALEGNDD